MEIQRLKEIIEKQSKEIEEYKKQLDLDYVDMHFVPIERYNQLEKEIEKYKNVIDNREFTWKQKYEETFEYVKENFINQDKIKEILGIEEDINNEKLLSLLQTIVDENARLEDIEDRKVQIEYNNVFNKGVKSVEDKIKATIEELDENGYWDFLEKRDEEKCKDILQSLLEKE